MVADFINTVYGPISGDFAQSPLGDLCVSDDGVQTGPFGSQLHASDYVNHGTPIITVEHLGDNRIIHVDLPLVSDEDKERLSKYTLKTSDIVFSRVGSVDRRAIVHSCEDGWLFSGRCLRVRPDQGKIDPGYLSWFLGLPGFKEHIRQIAVGATMPSLNTTILNGVVIYYPASLKDQQAIAHILGTLDDKIELNRRMNETLEAMARAIFTSWFVDFDPVRAKAEGRHPEGLDAATAALFPASFEDSPLGEIPVGWRVGNIGDLASNRRIGVDPSQLRPGTPYIGLEHMPRKSMALFEWGQADGVASNKFRFFQGDILFGKLRPYFHKVGVAPLDGVCSTDILVILPKKPHYFALALAHVSSEDLIQYVDAASTGTKMPRTNWHDIAGYKIVIPDENVLKKLDDEIRPMIDSIKANIHESRTLADMRDALLPRLMSGKTRVADVNKCTGGIC